MRLGFFVNAFRNFSLEYALESLSKYGYEGVELWAKGEHIRPFDSEKNWEDVGKLVDSKGFVVYAISAHLDFVAPGSEKRKEEISKFRRVIQMARFLGVGQVHTASGGLYSEISHEKQEEYFVEAMRELGDVAARNNVIIALEPEPEKWLSTPQQTLDIINNRLGADTFKVVADLGHAFAIGMTPSEYLKSLGSALAMIHFDDVRKGDFPHRHLIPGDGDIDYADVFKTIRELKYDSWLSMELNRHNEKPKEAAERAYEFMRRNIDMWR